MVVEFYQHPRATDEGHASASGPMNLDARTLGLRRASVSLMTYTCLPDTVDPRGPREGRRVSTEAEDIHRTISVSVRDMLDAYRIQHARKST